MRYDRPLPLLIMVGRSSISIGRLFDLVSVAARSLMLSCWMHLLDSQIEYSFACRCIILCFMSVSFIPNILS